VKSVNTEYKNKTGHNPVFYLPMIGIGSSFIAEKFSYSLVFEIYSL